jgi:amidase
VNDLWRLDATAQAELVREKSVRPIELVEAAITRIERLNPKLNAVVTPMYDRDARRGVGGSPRGALRRGALPAEGPPS